MEIIDLIQIKNLGPHNHTSKPQASPKQAQHSAYKTCILLNECDQFSALISPKQRPKSVKTEQNVRILKNIVRGPTRHIEGNMTGMMTFGLGSS